MCEESGEAFQLSENRAFGLVGITRWINRYQSRRDPQDQLRRRLRELAGNRPRYGYRRLTVMLRLGNHPKAANDNHLKSGQRAD